MVHLIWCPSIDSEMRGNMDSFMCAFPKPHKTALEGGQKQLGGFDPLTHKLYIVAHGHEQMPLFACNKQRWTEPVGRLVGRRWSTPDWREIELLVCHAGQSVNTAKVGEKLLAIHQKSLTVAVDPAKVNSLRDQYNAIAPKGQRPSPFLSQDQLLPLAAQFVHSLKTHNPPYTNFLVTSYAVAVCQHFSLGYVTLDLTGNGGPWGALPAQYPHLIKVWH